MSRRKLELPPALETRQGNKGKCVGGPDMPKPRRKSAEVAADREKKAAEQEQAEQELEEAYQRVLALREGLHENALTVRPATRSQTSTTVPQDADPKDDTLAPSLKSSGVTLPAGQTDDNIVESEDAHPIDEAGSPAPGDDDYTPDDEGDEGSEDSAMEIDDEQISEQKGKRRSVGKAGGNGGKKRGKSAGMGKRKQDALGDEPSITPKVAKKAKAALARRAPTNSAALVADWQEALQARSPSLTLDAATIPANDENVPSRSRSSSRMSTTSSILPSTAGETSDSADGFRLEDELETEAATYPAPSNNPQPSTTRVNDIRAALQYRLQPLERAVVTPSDLNDGGSGSAAGSIKTTPGGRAAVIMSDKHPLTKIIRADPPPPPEPRDAGESKTCKRQRPTRGAKDAGRKPKPTIGLLPAGSQRVFTARFVPLTRQYAGALEPWQDITFAEYEVLYRRAYGNALADDWPFEEDDVCHKLIQAKVSDWRAKFALASADTFKEILTDPDVQEIFANPEAVSQYAIHLLGDGKAAPFYWREWNNGTKKKGRLQGDLIIGSFASHIAELQNVPPGERTGESPRAALGMATLAAMHTLTHYQSGEWKPPTGRAGWFSADNYGDTVIFVDGKQKNDKKVTRIMKVVDALTPTEWLEIMDAAREVVIRRQTAPGKRSKSGNGAAGAAAPPDADVPEDSDDDLMLVADA